MTNVDVGAAWAYHEATKHSLERVRADRYMLDWETQPLPFKIYTSLVPIPLPRELPDAALPALEAIAGRRLHAVDERVPDRSMLARLCLYANGVTKTLRWSGGEMPFRAAACTGALYHVELYLVCGPLPDLDAGVYHYAAHDHSLRLVRRGDVRACVEAATGAEAGVAQAPVVVACTSTFWRNAWKYRARAYRHSFWDTGTILANLLAVAAAHNVPAGLILGFADDAVNRLLDVDPSREAAICLVTLGTAAQAATPAPPPSPEPLGLRIQQLSAHEVDYPEITAVHAASSLGSGAEAATWRAGAPDTAPDSASLHTVDLPTAPIEEVIRQRGSARRFARTAIDLGQLSTLLDVATRRTSSDVAAAGPLSRPYLIVNAVDGLNSGTYAFDRQRRALERLRLGSFREAAGLLDLGQELAADAAINLYWLADLHAVLRRFGNRGYRAAQLEAAIEAGRVYLAAYALGLGATGLTFFDDDVTRFFSPHAADQSVLFLMAVGRPARRRTPL